MGEEEWWEREEKGGRVRGRREGVAILSGTMVDFNSTV